MSDSQPVRMQETRMHAHKLTTRLSAVLTALTLLGSLVLQPTSRAAGKLQIMTATTNLASLAQEVGGDKIEVESIARGYQDPHFVDAKPSFLLKLKRADLLIVVGLELEIGWLPPLINQSTNPKIQVGAPGYFDASRFAKILEIPTGQVTRAEGDGHPLGNHHYWLDPENELRLAKGIADNDSQIVTYHRSWPNFADHFHLNVVGYVEPRPGIPPSPQHTVELIQQMKRENVKVIVVEPYFDLKTPNAVARDTGGQVLVLPPSVGGEKEITDYFKLFDYDISKLKQAFDATH